MARKNPHRPFAPDPDQMAVFPDISGNDVNGLGEETPRPARMVYWAPNPPDIAHGPLQMYFYGQSAKVPAFAEARAIRQEIIDAPISPLAEDPVARASIEWTNSLERFVESGDCEMIGVAKIQEDWIVEGHDVPWSHVIMLGVHHDYEELSQAPQPEAGLEVMAQYTRAAAATKKIASWLHEQGWEADPLTGPMTGALLMIPPALACGFGELGKHGSIINPEVGSAFRLSAVLTNAPFATTPSIDAGIQDFCASCRVCEDACPPEAIYPEKQTVRGEEKWYVNFDKCLPFFNQHHGCAICIAVCPWSRPGVGPNLAAKLARRAERLENDA